MLRILTLSTLFPDASRPNFGIFVERQTQGLAALPDVAVKVVAPVGLPPFPLAMASRYRALSALPQREGWHGLDVYRPRFTNIPGTNGRWSMPFMLIGAVGCMSMGISKLSICLYTGQNSLLSRVFWLMLEKR